MIKLLFNVSPALFQDYREPILTALQRRNIAATAALPGGFAPDEVDYIIHATGGPVIDFSVFTKARAVLSLWAGVEKIVGNATLTCRCTDCLSVNLSIISQLSAHIGVYCVDFIRFQQHPALYADRVRERELERRRRGRDELVSMPHSSL